MGTKFQLSWEGENCVLKSTEFTSEVYVYSWQNSGNVEASVAYMMIEKLQMKLDHPFSINLMRTRETLLKAHVWFFCSSQNLLPRIVYIQILMKLYLFRYSWNFKIGKKHCHIAYQPFQSTRVRIHGLHTSPQEGKLRTPPLWNLYIADNPMIY